MDVILVLDIGKKTTKKWETDVSDEMVYCYIRMKK